MVIKDQAWEKQQWQTKEKWQEDKKWEESKTGWEKYGYTTPGKGQGNYKKKEGQWEDQTWRERSPRREPQQHSTAQSSNYETDWQVAVQQEELTLPKPTIS